MSQAFTTVATIDLTQPIRYRESDCWQLELRRPTIGDLSQVDCSPILSAFGLDDMSLERMESLDEDTVHISMARMMSCSKTLLALLEKLTRLARPQLEQIAACDLVTALGVVLPLLLPSAPAGGSAGG